MYSYKLVFLKYFNQTLAMIGLKFLRLGGWCWRSLSAAWSSNSSLHCGSLVTQPRSSSHWAGFPQYSCSLPIISQYQSWSVHAKMNRKKRVLPGPLFRSYTWLIQINKDNTSSVFYSAFESTKFTEELFVNAFWMKLFFWKLYPQYVGTGTPMVHHLWNILFGCILCQMHCASSK